MLAEIPTMRKMTRKPPTLQGYGNEILIVTEKQRTLMYAAERVDTQPYSDGRHFAHAVVTTRAFVASRVTA